ncbi:hypothetical protein HETIRDRAFT_314721 [Heterobasidion irregulare TC 32-1]|uniref:20S-pre-rRNA D-site endonuclease NOB1 n=1 Tax=Heterobasidion irregulare (strain TC 32-1) TaxID=747525 RepID=W4KFQ5_HETIT|nr:uncharacterized protein HETIRDRAFT_314721 [Heterobasidion irregulare TC 32-1]ETW84145.1 hypothetical protein HETIRDRAFT_314721 [Heterobasidion irregulare TC 32-1]
MASSSNPACKYLVLDAGPLLSLSPLRGLAETYLTVPHVLNELKDKRAREHFERLGLSTGVRVEIRSPDAASLAHAVIQFAKKTGDYSVLSTADLAVLALTYALDIQERKRQDEQILADKVYTIFDLDVGSVDPAVEEDMEEREPLHVELHPTDENSDVAASSDNLLPSTSDHPISSPSTPLSSQPSSPAPIFDDPSDDDDGEGEWITPSNVTVHKSRALGLTPPGSGKGKAKEKILVGCMTADFAMQNVLLQMSLDLVGVEGKKIEKVKTWVLRCHACFKICKDSSKKFCPSCGNPTLLRASVTISSPKASSDAPTMQVHLKKNFQYKTRGTIYSIPKPKPGSAKTGNGEGLILREDQTEYMRAKKQADSKRLRDEKKILNGALLNGGNSDLNVGNWMDPDWIPDIISAGASGKGRTPKGRKDDMPAIGYGRKNPNERKHHK